MFLPGLGVHKFILGMNGAGTVMLTVTLGGAFLFPFVVRATGDVDIGAVTLWASAAMILVSFIEGIRYLKKTDEEFYQSYMVRKKEWF